MLIVSQTILLIPLQGHGVLGWGGWHTLDSLPISLLNGLNWFFYQQTRGKICLLF